MKSLRDSGHPGNFSERLPDPISFFDSTVAAFMTAKEHCNVTTERFFRIGPHTIKLEFAGDGLLHRITRALEHLAVMSSPAPAPAPALTVLIWDDTSTHTRMPSPPWLWHTAPMRHGEIRGYNTNRIYTVYNREADVLNVLDLQRKTAIYWTRDVRHLPSYETSAPLRTILHWFAFSHGGHVAHSAAVGTPAGGVLLAGKGGSGKSTSVLACLSTNLNYVGDDYCLLTLDPIPFAHSLYCSAKLNTDNLARVPHVIPSLSNPHDLESEKAVLFLNDQWGHQLISGFPILAILLPRIRTETHTHLTPTPPDDALKALVLSTVSQLPRAGSASLQFMSKLVSAVPCYQIELGADLAQVPNVIIELIGDELVHRGRTAS